MVAFQASKGAVSGYIQRYMDALPQNTWNGLRGELAKRFSDVTDSQYALSLLRSEKGKRKVQGVQQSQTTTIPRLSDSEIGLFMQKGNRIAVEWKDWTISTNFFA